MQTIFEYFGKHNRKLAHFILDLPVSNKSWAECARADDISSPANVMDRFRADLWEAYWATIFLECEMWDDDQKGLIACLRGLFYVWCTELIDNYTMDPYSF